MTPRQQDGAMTATDAALLGVKAVVLGASWLVVVLCWAWASGMAGALKSGAAGHARPLWENSALWLLCGGLPAVVATAGAIYATRGARPWLWYRLAAACVPALALALSAELAHAVLAGA